MRVSMKTTSPLILCGFLLLQAVNAADINVALGQPASQSSVYYVSKAGYCVASRAVDGNYNTDIGSGSCAGTKDPAGGANWWLVDLGQRMHIKLVVVTNRGDIPACANRLDYFIVGVSNATTPPVRGKYTLCGQYPTTAVNGAKLYLECDKSTPSAQYVIVQQPSNGTGWLTLCEVEIYPRQATDTNSWERHKDLRLSTTTGIIIGKKRSTIHCICACKNTPQCDSINYRPADNCCEMNFFPRGSMGTQLINASGWNWWRRIYVFD